MEIMQHWSEFELNLNKLLQAFEHLKRENRMLRKENVTLRQQRADLQQNQQAVKARLLRLKEQLKQAPTPVSASSNTAPTEETA